MEPAGRLPLTVVVPVYGRAASLRSAIESIANQAEHPESVLVVDDGSPVPVEIEAGIREVLPITLIRHERNRGAAAARNTGLHAATSGWITFLDSDDRLAPDTLGARWRAAMAHQRETVSSTRTLYGCGWADVTPAGKTLGLRVPRPSAGVADFAAGCWFSPGSCVILNRRAALAVGGQDDRLHRLEDLDWFLALALAGFVFVPQPIIGARIERRRSLDPAGVRDAAEAIRHKWARERLPAPVRRNLAAYLDLETAAACHFAGARVRAAFHLARSFARRPRRSLHLSPGWDRPPSERHGRCEA